MHVAINGWFWDQPGVGSGLYLRELLTAMARVSDGGTFTLVTPAHIGTPDDLPEGVKAHTTGGGPSGKLGKVWFEQNLFPGAVKQLDADLAHVPYWGPPLSSPAPLVTSVLDVIPLLFPVYAEGFANRLYVSLVRAAAQGSAHIITLTEASKADIVEQLVVPDERVTAIHLAPKPDYHPKMGSERDPEVAAKYNLPDDPFVLYLGGFDARKRLGQLFGAYSFVAKAHGDYTPLVIAGHEPEYREPLFPDARALAAEAEVPEDNIHWIGYVDAADMPALYRLAEIFVYPSAYEGFGLPLLEAMASGTPTVANNIEMFSEIVGDGAFLTEDGSIAKMGGAILAMLEQQDLYESMSNRGLARASNFNWRKTARATLDVYKRALNEAG
ncbi:MAG: glycosyltransferase family 1 protein [Chloroflexota bacterium]